ncbi:hypothetical protein Nham_4614 (plasmid) [Nitrobacter hamburgensis X14]|uniref:Uncharacterized protein n=1 Tax=Nitrobacter hamburgensis (strain DSM 10229 / NCIMB 13809 / X14) TaxID=323097 RepID=Q1QF21_NITHX|nr:hypothetical protein [Nitrobacter hamburgensis]ABE65176.1 hypothetical protein Nham_4614 [Nitrobacter hamburgensis X14]
MTLERRSDRRRAFRWREMLENGTHATIAEIATAEKINETYGGGHQVRRMRADPPHCRWSGALAAGRTVAWSALTQTRG